MRDSGTLLSDLNLQKVTNLTREMIALADEGDRDRTDDSCAIIYAILRDSAYRLRQLVEKECQKHVRVGGNKALFVEDEPDFSND